MPGTKISATQVLTDTNNQFVSASEKQAIAASQSITIGAYENTLGMYVPFMKAESLSATTGLANHASRGIVAAVAGTTGSGSMYLPKPIDPSKPWRCAVLVEVNDSQPITELHFSDAAKTFFCGLRITSLSTATITGSLAGQSGYYASFASDGIPAGTQLWIGMVSDGNTITAFHIPAVPSQISFGSPGSANWSTTAYASVVDATVLNGSNFAFGSASQPQYRLCRLAIATKSTTNRIIGVHWAQSLNGPKDGQLKPPFILRHTILQDITAWVVMPGTQGYQPTDIVMLPHPNGNTGYYGMNNLGNSAELLKLYTAGYGIFGITGAYNQNDYAGAAGSNWGAQTGMRYRKAHLEFIRANIPLTRNLYLVGQSMGCMNSLTFALEHPGTVKAIVGISGVCDLYDSYANRGFGTTIQSAYGTWYACNQAATGIRPDIVVNVTNAATLGATTITVTALSAALPSGTTITYQTGTGPAMIITSAAAASGATSLSVMMLSSAVSASTKYNMSAYFTQISWGYGAPDDVYYKAPYVWLNTYTAATAYIANNVVCLPATLTNMTLNYVDPNLNPSVYRFIPIKIYQGDADTLIPPVQSNNFKASVEAAGGSVTIVTTAGAAHLDSSLYKGDEIVAFFQANP